MAETSSRRDGKFPVTQWTLVARLHHHDAEVSARALDELCAQYHYPLYCFIRARGRSHHDAEDVLHDFLAKLLRLEAFHDLRAEHGRLRTFLVTALDRFLITCHHRQKRRQEREVLMSDGRYPLDPHLEERYAQEKMSSKDTPATIFDRQWCEELLRHVLQQLEGAYAAKGKAALFATLRPVLMAGGSLRGQNTPSLAAALSMTEGCLRTTLLRLLRDYRRLLEDEVRQTVSAAADVQHEIEQFRRALGRA